LIYTESPFFYIPISSLILVSYSIKFIFAFWGICSIPIAAKAQSIETIHKYYDNLWNPILDSKQAAYYRTVEQRGDVIVVRDYSISGKLQRMAECSRIEPILIFDGHVVWYYDNGTVKAEAHYRNHQKIGIYKTYYVSGDIEMEQFHEPGKKIKYINYFNSSGDKLLSNGEGVMPAMSLTGESYTIIADSVSSGTFKIDAITRDTVFYALDHMAKFRGGLEGLARYLQLSVKYPKDAIKRAIQGTVFVSFVVDKDGTVRDWRVVKGLNVNCDKAALNAVASMPNWIPAECKGMPVKCAFVLPIEFKL
jgi:periplasmic protein TonB